MEYKKLGEIALIRSGGTPSRSNKKYWDKGTIPWIKISDIKNKYVEVCGEYITKEGLENSSAKLFKKGTILYTIFATIGEVAILNFEATTNQAIVGVELTDNAVSKEYLYYYLKSIRKSVVNIARGVAQNNINMGILREFNIPLPRPETQNKIVEVLDKAKALIDARKEQIRLMDELVQSVFYEMFGDPVKNPKGWEVKKLENLTTKILSGNTPKGGKQVYVKEGILFFRSQNVWRNRLEIDDVAYIDKKIHARMKNSSLKNKDILMTKTGRINTENSSLGRAAMFLGEDDSANINGHVYLIRLKEVVVHEFVLFILTTDEYREHIRRVCVGGIDKRQINKEHLEEFPIIIPPIEQQNTFVEYFKYVNNMRVYMKQSLEKLENNFNSLMQKAFNGELF